VAAAKRDARVALLRAVNLPGRNRIGADELRSLAASVGLRDARTLLQTGNLVFRGGGTGEALEAALERAAALRLGLQTDCFVRTAAQLREVVARNPFPEAARHDPAHLVVSFLKETPTPAAVAALRAAIPGRETVSAVGRHLYAVYPDGIGRSHLTAALMDRKLETRGTARNWNTVLKLADLAGA